MLNSPLTNPCSQLSSLSPQTCPSRINRACRQPRPLIACPAFGKPSSQKTLDERILSGEFGDKGSTKERMSRPLRKFLASDPTGLGAFGSIPNLQLDDHLISPTALEW